MKHICYGAVLELNVHDGFFDKKGKKISAETNSLRFLDFKAFDLVSIVFNK